MFKYYIGRFSKTLDPPPFVSKISTGSDPPTGLYTNYVILFWSILDTPLPPVIMSSFDIPPPPDDAIYVKDNH